MVRKIGLGNLAVIRNFLIQVDPSKGTSEREISSKLHVHRAIVHRHVQELMKTGHAVRRNRRLFWSNNLVMHRDQVLLRESFYDCLRKSKLNIGELRQSHGFLFFRSKDGKDQLSIIPLAKEALPSAVEMIQLASRLHEEGRTPEIEKEAKALIEKWNRNVQEYRIHIRKKKVNP